MALGVEYEAWTPATWDNPPEAGTLTWDMLYIASDTGKNDITPFLTTVVQDRIEDLLIAEIAE